MDAIQKLLATLPARQAQRVRAAADLLMAVGASTTSPFKPEQALRYNGIGKTVIPFLQQAGLVLQDDFSSEMRLLSARSRSVMMRASFSDRASAATAIRSGAFVLDEGRGMLLDADGATFRQIRGCGRTAYLEIAQWAGVPPALKDVTPRRHITGNLSPAAAEARLKALAAATASIESLCAATPIEEREFRAVASWLRETAKRVTAVRPSGDCTTPHP